MALDPSLKLRQLSEVGSAKCVTLPCLHIVNTWIGCARPQIRGVYFNNNDITTMF